MSKKLLFKGGHRTGMTPYEIEDFLSLYMRDARVDEKTKAYIDSVIGNSVLNLCPYRNVLVTHKYDTVEGNVVTLDDCRDDEIIQLSEIQGNTMVNCNKDTDKELILMPNLDTNGYSNITLTSGIDGGKVDVSLEGNTMVNVCDQEDSIAITKSYTVETGNHIALQGEYDGKCRPNIYGNTLVNLFNKDGNNVANPNIEFNEADMSYTTTNTEWCRLPRTSVVKPNTTYTYMYKFKTTSTKCDIRMEGKEYGSGSVLNHVSYTDLTQNQIYTTLKTFTTRDTEEFFNLCVRNAYDGVVTIYEPIILEGDYTNKPIPDYFTGMKSSFEDKLVPESIAYFPNTLCTTPSTSYKSITFGDTSSLKPSTMYTIVQKSHKTSNHAPTNTDKNPYCIVFGNHKGDSDLWTVRAYPSNGDIKEGLSVYTFTTPSDFSISTSNFIVICENNRGSEFELELFIVKGDYTNYDFTDYDSTKAGKYKVDYKVTGKNKFNGKSLLSTYITSNEGVIQNTVDNDARTWAYSQSQYFIPLSPGSYTISMHIINPSTDINNACRVCLPDDSTIISWGNNVFDSVSSYSANFTLNVHTVIGIELKLFKGATCKLQLEEGTTATTYEPYKESIKTLYLNSPLLEGDTIEQSGNNIIHNHRYKEVVLDGSEDENWTYDNVNLDTRNNFSAYYLNSNIGTQIVSSGESYITLSNSILCDKFYEIMYDYGTGSRGDMSGIATINTRILLSIPKSKLSTQDLVGFQQYLQQNPITVVYELATPTQEIISANDNLLLDSYTNGHLDVDTVVPIDKVVFKNGGLVVKYLYDNTDYIVQFEADNNGYMNHIYLGGASVTNTPIVKGLNKLLFNNIPAKDNWFGLVGIGFNASKIVVTPKVDNNFGYFKGMKSVGECEDNKIEILSNNKNLLNNLIPYPFDIIRGDFQNNNGALLGIVKVKPNTTYIMSATRDKKAGRIVAKMSNRTILPTELPNGTFSQDAIYDFLKKNYANGRNFEQIIYNQDYIKFTTFNDCNYLYVNVDGSYDLNKGDKVTINNVQIEEIKNNSNTPTPYTPHKSNKKEILLNEPLRGLPNGIKDKYVIIDGKWYIERNTVELHVANLKQFIFNLFEEDSNLVCIEILDYDDIILDNAGQCLCGNFAYNGSFNRYISTPAYSICTTYTQNKLRFAIPINKFTGTTSSSVIEYFKNNPVDVICARKQPTYEPIDYNPFEVYTDITHISNNSTIPCNMVIRNSGFNCILKPNTTYTVSSNNGLSSVVTKDSIGDSVLRFYNKDTSKITKMSNVLVLEGDYVTDNPPIPAFFTGMESAFEQELVTDEKDEHYGKYKVNVKAVGKNLISSVIPNSYQNFNVVNGNFSVSSNNSSSVTDFIRVIPGKTYIGTNLRGGGAYYDYNKKPILPINTDTTKPFIIPNGVCYLRANLWKNPTGQGNIQLEQGTKATEYEPYKENNITFYLNEPLRGVGDVKDKVYVKEDKVVVERNCASVIFDGSDDENWRLGSFNNTINQFNIDVNPKVKQRTDMPIKCDKVKVVTFNDLDYSNTYGINMSYYLRLNSPNCDAKKGATVKDLKQWLQQNPITVVYQLATPAYEEVECDLSKLALEGYNHGTLFYNSNIPVTTQFYDFKVNIKDMLIPNETYYITFIADRVKDITINLSGVQVNYKTSMGYNKVPVQLGDVVNTNFSMDSRGIELSDLMISTSTSLIYVKDMNDVCIYDEASNKYSVTITSTGGNESDKRVILLDYPLLRLNKDIYDRLYYNNKDSRYRIDKKVFKHKFTNDREYSKYAAETNDTYYSSFISLNENIKDYVVITNEKVKTVKVEDGKYYFKIKWSDLGVSDKTETNGNQGMKDFFNNNEVYLYYATDGFVEIIDGLRRQTLKVYQPETTMNFLGNTTTTVTIVIPKKNI